MQKVEERTQRDSLPGSGRRGHLNGASGVNRSSSGMGHREGIEGQGACLSKGAGQDTALSAFLLGKCQLF